MNNEDGKSFDLQSIKTDADRDPRFYVLKDEGLKTAIQMAIWLGKPLLLTGAPGTGKTQLAFKVAHELSSIKNDKQNIPPFLSKPFEFNTKTTSTATDLFYSYDAVRHFQKKYIDQAGHDNAANSKAGSTEISTAHPFIKLNALGMAILQAHGRDALLQNNELYDLQYLPDFSNLEKDARSSVVLIDEIDKAPRDFPNDLLYEIENLNFYISELMNKHVKKPGSGAQVVVIMTSNFEKNLPDAFLRRCLFYHIPSPKPDELLNIVFTRIRPHIAALYEDTDKKRYEMLDMKLTKNMSALVDEFEAIKSKIKDKQPATSELLEWVKGLEKLGFFDSEVDFTNLDEQNKKILLNSLAILTKSKDDIESLKKYYGGEQ